MCCAPCIDRPVVRPAVGWFGRGFVARVRAIYFPILLASPSYPSRSSKSTSCQALCVSPTLARSRSGAIVLSMSSRSVSKSVRRVGTGMLCNRVICSSPSGDWVLATTSGEDAGPAVEGVYSPEWAAGQKKLDELDQ